MRRLLKQAHRLHESKQGLLFFGLVELGLAYLCASLAINSGSLGQWILAIILTVGAVHNFGRLALRFFKID